MFLLHFFATLFFLKKNRDWGYFKRHFPTFRAHDAAAPPTHSLPFQYRYFCKTITSGPRIVADLQVLHLLVALIWNWREASMSSRPKSGGYNTAPGRRHVCGVGRGELDWECDLFLRESTLGWSHDPAHRIAAAKSLSSVTVVGLWPSSKSYSYVVDHRANVFRVALLMPKLVQRISVPLIFIMRRMQKRCTLSEYLTIQKGIG